MISTRKQNRRRSERVAAGWGRGLRIAFASAAAALLFGLQVFALPVVPIGGDTGQIGQPEVGGAEQIPQETVTETQTQPEADNAEQVPQTPDVQTAAVTHAARLVDEADLLTPDEETDLLQKLNEISERQQFDIVILTVDSLRGKSPNAYADDYYDENGYGFGENKDGTLFLLSMEERDWAISTTGYGTTVMTDYGQEVVMNEVLPYLRDGRYARAFAEYADQVDSLVTTAQTDRPVDIYDEEEEPQKKRGVSPFWLFGDLGIGALLASLPMNSAKRQLRTVRNRFNADIYAGWAGGTIQATGRMQDHFIRKTTNTRMIPVVTNRPNRPHGGSRPSGGGHGSTIHMGSSGTFHGGSHGKF
ncbi:MAG: TPM domain-containing protein [Lachnospiraceae bacterium]|nr:TPM domain-containing protein [Lachnospiraceae bacterium]